MTANPEPIIKVNEPARPCTPDEAEVGAAAGPGQALDEPQAPPLVVGPDGEGVRAGRLTLGLEKIREPGRKYFRLIWILGERAWLCQEDRHQYRQKWGPAGVVAAGQALVEKYGARRFSEVTR